MIGSEFCTWNEFYPGREEIEADMSCGNLYVLTEEEKTRGTAGLTVKIGLSERRPSFRENELDDLEFWSRPETAGNREEKACEIARIVVAPEYQGKGLAKKISDFSGGDSERKRLQCCETAGSGEEYTRLPCVSALWLSYSWRV